MRDYPIQNIYSEQGLVICAVPCYNKGSQQVGTRKIKELKNI